MQRAEDVLEALQIWKTFVRLKQDVKVPTKTLKLLTFMLLPEHNPNLLYEAFTAI